MNSRGGRGVNFRMEEANMLRKTTWLKILVTALTAGFLLVGCAGGGKATPTPQALDVDQYEPVVNATGEVLPVQWAALGMAVEGGVIEDLLVKEGQQVKKGDVLMRLSGTQHARAALTAAEAGLVAAEKALQNVHEQAALATADAELKLAQARKALLDAEEAREKKDYGRASQNTLDGLRADYILAQDAVDQAEKQFGYFEDREEDDVQRAQALTLLVNARKLRDRALYNLNYALGKPDPEEVAKADGAVSVAQAALEDAQRQYDRMKNGPDPDVLKQAEANLTNAEAQVESARQVLADLELKAPFAGVVSQIKVRTGEWVIAGQPVMMLADLAELQVETTDLSEIDVARLDVGNTAAVTFDALPDVVVQGVVHSIAPKSDEGAGVNYRVVVQLDEIPAKLRWGMTAFVDITVSE